MAFLKYVKQAKNSLSSTVNKRMSIGRWTSFQALHVLGRSLFLGSSRVSGGGTFAIFFPFKLLVLCHGVSIYNFPKMLKSNITNSIKVAQNVRKKRINDY